MNVEREVTFEKITSGQMGADMLIKHAAVGVVRYNKKLIGLGLMERMFSVGEPFFVFDDVTCWIFSVDWLFRFFLW